MEFNLGVFIAQLVNFVVILLLFKILVGDRLSKAIAQRREDLAKAADATVAYEETIKQAEADKKQIIAEALDHKQKLIDESSQAAQQKADQIVAQAQKQATNIQQEATDKANQLEKDLQDNFVDGVKKTAHIVVNKLFDKDVDLKDAYIQELAQEFGQSTK